jgi:hypothetical protein
VPSADVADPIYLLRDNLRRADAFVSTAEKQIERSWAAVATRVVTARR